MAGRAGSGKSTCAGLLVEHFGFVEHNFADELKREVQYIYGLTSEQTWNKKDEIVPGLGVTPRSLFQKHGQARRVADEDCWIKIIEGKYKRAMRLVIGDVRMPNEARWIKNNGGLIIQIHRENVLKLEHQTETPLPDDLVDHVIYNNGPTAGLFFKLSSILVGINANRHYCGSTRQSPF